MKILLNWLTDYIETGLGADEIADILSDLGLPCEGIEYVDDDAVIDIEVTSNRGDCLSYIGIARELSAITGREVKMPSVSLNVSDKDVSEFTSVEIADPDLCSRYTARIIEGVKIAKSPDWLKKRLEAVGMRSVNNVVDATNYAMLETGQPPHAFDYSKISGGKIIVRKAAAGERIVSIDGTKCELNPDMLIIADAKVPVAIAGVMGGLDTEVSKKTTTILLEDACFDPVAVRTSSRRLSLPSESSFRFERSVNTEAIDWASKRTAQLITEAAGGKVAKGVIDIYPNKPEQRKVTLRLGRLNKLLGIEIQPEQAIRILLSLGFCPEHRDDSLICSIPAQRHNDVYREADLIEEIARVHGYNKIPTSQKIEIEVVPVDTRQKLVQTTGTYLNGCGFYETVNVTFTDDSVCRLFTGRDAQEHLAVKDVSRKNANLLRQTLLGSLMGVLKNNLNVGNTPCRIFEIARTFVPADKKAPLPIEKTKLALCCDGSFRELRGVVEGLIKTVYRDAEIVFQPADLVWAEVGARILVNGQTIGSAGVVSKAVKEKLDFDNLTPCGAELEFDQLMTLKTGEVKVKPIPKYPAVVRDLSLLVDETVSWAQIITAVNKKACTELSDVKFVGIYRGKGIPAGQKSLTLSLTFRDRDGTLTHETVDDFEADILGSLKKTVGAELRA